MNCKLRKIMAGAAVLAGTLLGSVSAGEPVRVRVQLSVNGVSVPAYVWVSAVPEGMPPQVPVKADPDEVMLYAQDNYLVIKAVVKEDLAGVIRGLRVLTGTEGR